MTIPNIYDKGDLVKLSTSPAFKDADGEAADPTAVTFRIMEPDGTETTYVYGTDAELVKAGTGDYYVHWTCAKEGRHSYRFEGTGTVTAAGEQVFDVRDSAFY
ncbi:MAG: hypothetical protein AB7E70_20935 [Hyphomicrobiaceae bacterium]